HFGANPSIRLHGFGGVTLLPGGNFSRPQSILVSAAGPMAGLLLGCLVLLVVRAFGEATFPRLVRIGMSMALQINFIWTFINLLPIQPLDGGQIMRDVL